VHPFERFFITIGLTARHWTKEAISDRRMHQLKAVSIFRKAAIMFDATKAIIDFYEDSGEDEVSEEARAELQSAQDTIAARDARIEALEGALKEIANAADNGDCCCEVGEGFHAIECPVAIAGVAREALKAGAE
jgi:hypothetical protein